MEQNTATSAKFNNYHGKIYARILHPFLFSERYLAVGPSGQHIGFCTVLYPLFST